MTKELKDTEEKIIQNIMTQGLKLTKTTRGFTWEIRIKELDPEKIEKLNEQMEKRFGDERG